tara:strand:- start:6 stop:383 length:378 start_codon:yes stop_codon:yes gene_type:complete
MSKISVIEAIEKVKSLDGISSIMSSADVINLLEQIKDSELTFINLNDAFIEELKTQLYYSFKRKGNQLIYSISDNLDSNFLKIEFIEDEIRDSIDEAITNGIEVEEYELLQRQAEAEVFEILEKK